MDTFRIYIDFFNTVMGYLFNDLQQKRLRSFTDSSSGLKLYQVHLADCVQGKQSYLVPNSDIAAYFLDFFITPDLK